VIPLAEQRQLQHSGYPATRSSHGKRVHVPIRRNKRVGRAAKILMVLSVAAILCAIVVSVSAVSNQQAYPARGAASLPGQAASAGARTESE
jgi:cell division protein FtsL